MACNCNTLYPDEDMKRWESCPATLLADPQNYYTKHQVDELLDEIVISGGGVTERVVEEMIESAITPFSGDLSALSGEVAELSSEMENKADKSDIPSLSGYATEQWVENKGYLTEHQPLKTINGEVISGTGNITISGGGDMSNYYTKEETDNAINAATSGIPSSQTIEQLRTDVNAISGDVTTLSGEVATKLDASAYTPTDLSQYWTSAQTEAAISAHTANTTVHVTQSDKNYWNAKVDEEKFWCGSTSDYNLETESGTTINPDVIYFIYEDPQL